MRLASRSAPAVALAAAVLLTHSSAAQCFFPSGQPSNDEPCDPDAPVSMCCGSRDACLSSGLCRNPGTGPSEGTSFARGTCTDRNWRSPICPQRCQINPDAATNFSAYDFGTGGVQVWECEGQGYASPGAFCCESAREKTRCCQTASAVFTLPGASVGNALAVQTYPPPDDETDREPFVTTRRLTLLRGTSPVDSGGTRQTGVFTETGVSTGRSSGTTPSPTSGDIPNQTTESAAAVSSGSGGLSDAAKLGLGVGIGVAVTLLIGGVLISWYFMRSRAKIAAAAAAATAASSGGYQSQYPEGNSSELAGSDVHGTAVKELGGRSIAEMHTTENQPAEVYAVGGQWTAWNNRPELHAHGEHAAAELHGAMVQPPQYRWQ